MRSTFLFLALFSALFCYNQKDIKTDNEVTKLQKTKSKLWYLEGEVDGKVIYNSAKLMYVGVAILVVPWIHIYNKKAELITEWKVPRKEIKKMGYKYKGHQFNDNAQGYFVVKKKKKKKSKKQSIYFLRGDLNGNLSGKPIRVGSTFKHGGMQIHTDKIPNEGITILSEVFNHNSKRIAFTLSSIREKEKKPTFQGSFSIKWEPDNAYIQFYSKDDTTHYLVVRNYEKIKVDKDKKKTRKRLVTRLYTITGKKISQVDLDIEDDLAVTDLSIAKDGDKIKLLGHLSRISRRSFSGLIFGEVNAEKSKIEKSKQTEFNKSLLAKLNKVKGNKSSKKGKEPKKVVNKNYRLIESFATEDGGGIVVSQQKWVRVVTTTDSKGNVRVTYYYYYGDIAILKVDDDGELEWDKHLKSFNVYVNHDPGNPYTSMRKDGEIYLVYEGSQKANAILEKKPNAKLSSKQRRTDAIFCLKIHPKGKVILGKIYDYKANKRFRPTVTNAGIVDNTMYIPMKKRSGIFNFFAKRMLKIKFK